MSVFILCVLSTKLLKVIIHIIIFDYLKTIYETSVVYIFNDRHSTTELKQITMMLKILNVYFSGICIDF